MNVREFLNTNSVERVKSVAEEAGTNLANFRQIAYGGSVSAALARRLELASGEEMTLTEILFPEETNIAP